MSTSPALTRARRGSVYQAAISISSTITGTRRASIYHKPASSAKRLQNPPIRLASPTKKAAGKRKTTRARSASKTPKRTSSPRRKASPKKKAMSLSPVKKTKLPKKKSSFKNSPKRQSKILTKAQTAAAKVPPKLTPKRKSVETPVYLSPPKKSKTPVTPKKSPKSLLTVLRKSPRVFLVRTPVSETRVKITGVPKDSEIKKTYPKTPVREAPSKASQKNPVFSTPRGVYIARAVVGKVVDKSPAFHTPGKGISPAKMYKKVVTLVVTKNTPSPVAAPTRVRNTANRAASSPAQANTPAHKAATPAKVIKANPARVAKTTPAKVAQTTPARVTKTTPAKVAKITPARVTKTTPARVAKTTPARVTKTTPARVAKTTPARLAKTTPARVAKTIPSRAFKPSTPARAEKTPIRTSAVDVKKAITKKVLKKIPTQLASTPNTPAGKKILKLKTKSALAVVAVDTPPKAAKVLGKTPATTTKRKVTPGRRPMGIIDFLLPYTSTPVDDPRKRKADFPMSEIRQTKRHTRSTGRVGASNNPDMERSLEKAAQIEEEAREALSWWGWCTIL